MFREGEKDGGGETATPERRGTDGISPVKVVEALLSLWTRVTETEEDTTKTKMEEGRIARLGADWR